MYIQLSLSLQFYFFYLLLSSYDGKDVKQRVFLDRLMVAVKGLWFVAVKGAGCVVCWLCKVPVLV